MMIKNNNDLLDANFNEGEVILFNKPMDWTSFKVVHVVRKYSKAKKVGHAGTLDPKATGLLILCTGKKTKDITLYQEREKVYTGTIRLGFSTPSMDLEMEPEFVAEVNDITLEQILEAAKKFTGKILQIPPMFSAVKLNGKTLYNLARQGKTVVREPREVFINYFNITKVEMPEVHFEIKCSKGTYVRVIANDFGNELGCGAVLSSLCRTKIGEYDVKDAFELNDFLDLLKRKNELLANKAAE